MRIFSKNKPVFIYFFVLIFIFLIFLEFRTGENYCKISETDIISSAKQDVHEMISEKKNVTFYISQIIAHNENVIKIMDSKEYGKLRYSYQFDISKYYERFKHMGVYIIDRNGIYVYTPFGESEIKDNTDYENYIIKNLLFSHKTCRIKDYAYKKNFYKDVCIDKKGIVFKGISPIYDLSDNLLGLVEVDTHFNSIAQELGTRGINSAVVVDRKYAKFISSPLSKTVIDGYPIININIKPSIVNLIKKYGIKNILSIKNYKYLIPKGNMITGYYTLSIPIKDKKDRTLGYYLIFMYDSYGLAKKEATMQIITALMFLMFIGMSYMGYRYKKINDRLIGSLNKRSNIQTKRNIELLYVDTLTDTFNKVQFDKDIKDIKQGMYVVMFDIKNFSKINAIYGFKTGDKVLSIVAKRIKNIVDSKLYRIHADTFVFITDNYKRDIEKIRDKFIKEPLNIQNVDVKLRLSFSFGVCKTETDDVLSKVSIALKEAKQSPYMKFSVYKEQKIDMDFVRFNAMLYDALFHKKEAQIVPYFQGIRDNKTGEIKKFEALARLVAKERVYTPFFFMDIAKSSGFIYEITKIMLEKSIQRIVSLDSDIDISVNITEDDLNKGHLAEYIDFITGQYNIPTKRITLEILEGITSSGTKNNIRKLKELKELGVKLALDDFGVEYSNFERIAELDIDFIKIDAKYIKDLVISARSRKIVKAITDFAHSIDMKVVAEFVENQDVQNIIESFQIDYSQGYLFSKPEKDIETLNKNQT